METFSALLALCAGNTPVTDKFPPQRPVTRSFDVFFGLRLNKRLNKQSRLQWFKTPLRLLWRQCNDCTVHFKVCSFFCLRHARFHDDVIKWKHFPRNWPFVRRIHRSPVNSPHKGQWRGALMFTLICVWINGWVNDREAGDLRRYHGHYDVIVMLPVDF